MSICGSKDAQTTCGSTNQNGLSDGVRVPSALNQRVHEPAADGKVCHGRDEPWNAGVKEGVQQIDVQRGREIAGQPGEEQVEDVVVGAEPQDHPDDLALPEEITEGGLSGFIRSEDLIVCLDVVPFNGGQVGIILGVAIDPPERQEEEEA